MLKKYRNDIYRLLFEEFKLDPNWFNVSEFNEKELNICEVAIKSTNIKFQFINPSQSWDHFKYRFSNFAPVTRMTDIIPRDANLLEYTPVIIKFKEWINRHAIRFIEDAESIDKWSGLAFERNLFEIINIDSDDNSVFNNIEQQDIQIFMSKIRQNIIDEFSPDDFQLHEINQKLNYVIESSIRLGRKDWKGILISSVISLAITLSVSNETGRRLVDLFMAAFESLRTLIEK